MEQQILKLQKKDDCNPMHRTEPNIYQNAKTKNVLNTFLKKCHNIFKKPHQVNYTRPSSQLPSQIFIPINGDEYKFIYKGFICIIRKGSYNFPSPQIDRVYKPCTTITIYFKMKDQFERESLLLAFNEFFHEVLMQPLNVYYDTDYVCYIFEKKYDSYISEKIFQNFNLLAKTFNFKPITDKKVLDL